MNQIQHKRGSTFEIEVDLPKDFSGYKVESQLRKLGNHMPSGLVANLSAKIITSDGKSKAVLYYKDTSSWPDCDAEFDVRLTSENSEVVITPSVSVTIVRAITK